MDEAITPYHFRTRQINLEFTEAEGKKVKTYQMIAFFIEDDDLVAKRFHAKSRDFSLLYSCNALNIFIHRLTRQFIRRPHCNL